MLLSGLDGLPCGTVRDDTPGRPTSPRTFVARHATPRIRTTLMDTRIVALVGPQQSGKTTLAQRVAKLDGQHSSPRRRPVPALRPKRSDRIHARPRRRRDRRDSASAGSHTRTKESRRVATVLASGNRSFRPVGVRGARLRRRLPAIDSVGPTRDLVHRVLSGGYPERDVAESATVDKPAEMTRLLDHAAMATSQLPNRPNSDRD